MFKNIRSVALATCIEGLITLIWLASIPSGGGIFSPVRLMSLSGILLIALGGLILFIYAGPDNKLVIKAGQFIANRMGIIISFLLTAASFALWVMILYKEWALSMIAEAVYIRLIPMAAFGAILCLQSGILFLIPNTDKNSRVGILDSIWKPTLILLIVFLAVWSFISITQLGFRFDNVGLSWGPPGAPISFPQINLVFTISLTLAFAYSIIRSRLPAKIMMLPIMDIIIVMGLWTLAVILWWHTPVSATHFNPIPMAPNHESYPNSDALIFDKSAYHLLYGIGFKDQLIRRPLYVGMLALFHKLGGFNYDSAIFFQILMLACIPALTYLLTSKLSNRLAGIIAGGLILLREKNAIELSDKIVTSNAKLMMSDMVAMLGILAFVYITLKILSRKADNFFLLGIAGACLGLTALVRAQVIILVPPLLLFMLVRRMPLKLGIRDSALIMLGFALVLLPWGWRNWQLTGTFVLDDRGEERLLARNYSSNPSALPPPLPGETEKQFSARLKQEIAAFIVQHPSDVTFFISNHFFRNLATSLVYMAPLLSNTSPRELIATTPLWEDWEGQLSGNGNISILITLTFIALGVAITQKKNRLAGWFLLITFLFYNFGNALVRSSGWRFSLPVEWVILVYYSVALAYFPSKIKIVFDGNAPLQSDIGVDTVSKKQSFGLIVFFILLLMGASVPMAEQLTPPRDFSNLTDRARDKLFLDNIISPTQLETFLENEKAIFDSGIALYPRYITPASRVYLANTPPRDFNFLHFWLINDGDNQIIFPADASPDVFPHTSMVSILGCREANYIVARVIILHSSPDQILFQDVPFELSCPMNLQK